MSFGGLILTNDGRNEIAKAELGQTFLITNVILGDGFYSGSYNAIASLVNPVMTLPIGKIERKESEVWLEIEFSSKDVPKAFYLREVGIIANGKLCYYDNSGDDAEFINPDAANLIQQKRMRFILLISQECQVNVSVNSSLYALEDDFENAVDELEKKKVDISGGDISDTVATLDETAGDATDNIASGESLRTILSKVHKVIRQFFIHKSDTVIHTTKADKDKLAGIEEHANNYVHPDTHPAGMITSDANHRFVTDDKIAEWSNSLGASKTYTDGMYRQATAYADKKVADLIGGAPESLDTLKEVADAIKENESVMDALDAAVGKKANQSELDTHVDNSTIHIPSGGSSGQILRWSADGTAVWGADNNTTYGAAGTSLGLVKSGGDVTISSGTITVNDDSHNHVISNVDGLQTALDGKATSSHTHNYAGSASAGGDANKALGVADYNNSNRTIKVGYNGAGLSPSDILYIAGYAFEAGSSVSIKDISKSALQSWLGLGSSAYEDSSTYASASHTHSYLPLSGGTLTNGLSINPGAGTGNYGWIDLYRNNTKSFKFYTLNDNSGAIHQVTGGAIYLFADIGVGVRTQSGAAAPIYASAFTNNSSRRVKKNITTLTDDEARKLLDINVVTYDYIAEVGGAKAQRGVIAEEVYNIIPSVVDMPKGYDENTELDFSKPVSIPGVDYSKFVPYLIKMIQIQQKEIDELKKAITE